MTVATGGCQCGGIKYEIELDQALTLYCCHCLECQRQAAGAFGMSMLLPRGAFHLLRGELKAWERDTDRGTRTCCHFCPDCGVRIYHAPKDGPDVISLKAGSLDDKSALSPVGHVWMSRAQPWVQTAASALLYDAQPDDYGDLIAAYKAQVGK